MTTFPSCHSNWNNDISIICQVCGKILINFIMSKVKFLLVFIIVKLLPYYQFHILNTIIVFWQCVIAFKWYYKQKNKIKNILNIHKE